MKRVQEIVDKCERLVRLDRRINKLLEEQDVLDINNPDRARLGKAIHNGLAKFEEQIRDIQSCLK